MIIVFSKEKLFLWNRLKGCMHSRPYSMNDRTHHHCPLSVLCLLPNQGFVRKEYIISHLFRFPWQAVQKNGFFLGKGHHLPIRLTLDYWQSSHTPFFLWKTLSKPLFSFPDFKNKPISQNVAKMQLECTIITAIWTQIVVRVRMLFVKLLCNKNITYW